VDFSTGMLAQARRARLGAGWVRADARALPCRGFDLAVSFGALGHFLRAERPALFAGVDSALRPGGVFAVPVGAAGSCGEEGDISDPAPALDEAYKRIAAGGSRCQMASSITAPWPAKRRPSWTAPRTLTAGRAGSPRRAASGSSRWRLPALSGGKPSATEIAAWTLASQLTASVRSRRPPSWRGPPGPRAEQPPDPANTNAGRPVGISQGVNAPRTSGSARTASGPATHQLPSISADISQVLGDADRRAWRGAHPGVLRWRLSDRSLLAARLAAGRDPVGLRAP